MLGYPFLMSFQWKFSHFLQMKFSSMEKIAIFANESVPFVLDSTMFWNFLQEAVSLSTTDMIVY